MYLNFNDYGSAVNSLFAIMFLNDWQFLVDMYVSVCTGFAAEMVPWFFIWFICRSNYLVVNILVAFIIETYSSIEQEV